MDAYLNFMTSVMRFWMNWMGSVMRFGMNAPTEALMPSPNVFIRPSASSDQQADVEPYAWDVGEAAPMLDMRGVRIWTPDIRLVLNTTFYCGDITGGATAGGSFDTERQPGSVAEHDRGRADRELTVQRTVSLTPPRTDAALLDAYLNFMTSVMRFWMNWMGSVMRFGMNAPTEALMPSPNVFIRPSASSDQQADVEPYAWDVGKAAPLLDMRGVRIWTPVIRVMLNTTFYCGDITGGATAGGSFDTERQPGSVAEHDRGRADREPTVQRTVSLTPSRTDAAPPAGH